MSRRRPPPLQHMSVCAYGEISFSRVPNFVSPQLLTHNRPRFVCKIVYSLRSPAVFLSGQYAEPRVPLRNGFPFRSAFLKSTWDVFRAKLAGTPLAGDFSPGGRTDGRLRTSKDGRKNTGKPMRLSSGTWPCGASPPLADCASGATARLGCPVLNSQVAQIVSNGSRPDARPLHAYKERPQERIMATSQVQGVACASAVLPRRDARRVSVPIEYAPAATRETLENPISIARITASTVATTEATPLTAQAQGISRGSRRRKKLKARRKVHPQCQAEGKLHQDSHGNADR